MVPTRVGKVLDAKSCAVVYPVHGTSPSWAVLDSRRFAHYLFRKEAHVDASAVLMQKIRCRCQSTYRIEKNASAGCSGRLWVYRMTTTSPRSPSRGVVASHDSWPCGVISTVNALVSSSKSSCGAGLMLPLAVPPLALVIEL